MTKQTIGQRMRAMRQRIGITQTLLAQIMDVGRTVVVHWERGVRNPSKMAVAFLTHLRGCKRRNEVSVNDVVAELEKQGHVCIVNRDIDCNLKGNPDVVAFKNGNVRLIQIRRESDPILAPNAKFRETTKADGRVIIPLRKLPHVGGFKTEVWTISEDGKVVQRGA